MHLACFWEPLFTFTLIEAQREAGWCLTVAFACGLPGVSGVTSEGERACASCCCGPQPHALPRGRHSAQTSGAWVHLTLTESSEAVAGQGPGADDEEGDGLMYSGEGLSSRVESAHVCVGMLGTLNKGR